MVTANAKCDETTARNYKNEREPRGRVHFSGINPVFWARDGENRFNFHVAIIWFTNKSIIPVVD